MSRPEVKTAAAITFGCRLNQTDTALIFDRLRQAGYAIVPFDEAPSPDLIVINTCCVTAEASRDSRRAARAARAQHPRATIVVTGCGVEVPGEFPADDPDVDYFAPNAEKLNLATLLEKKRTAAPPAPAAAPREDFRIDATGHYPFKSRANLKIQEGCDNFCAYCVVPYGRGRSRSRRWDDALREFSELVRAGYREIVLTGVNICLYRSDGKSLSDLVAAMVAMPGDFRLRLGSTEPHPENRRLLKLARDNPKICRFLHLPLQHGSDVLLKRMGRTYSAAEFREFFLEAAETVPGVCLGVDVIVGLPGESDALFAESAAFIETIAPAYLHVFRYSKRPGTPAATFPDQVPGKISAARARTLSALNKNLSAAFVRSQLGQTVPVLWESRRGDRARGWSDNYIDVRAPFRGTDAEFAATLSGRVAPARLTSTAGFRQADGVIA